MDKLLVFYVLVCYLFVITAGGSSGRRRKERAPSDGWGYTKKNGPSVWAGYCKTGARQSPINIKLGNVTVKNFPSFTFKDNYLSKHKFTAKNNGHTIFVTLEDDSIQPTIFGGGLGNKFIFEQLHMHWESEHEFDGKRADMEMHLVHYNSKYKSFAEAAAQPDGIVVLAVIFDKTNETDNLIEGFFDYILDISTFDYLPSHPAYFNNSLPGAHEVESSGFFALRDLLPQNLSRFFRYEGSLTTPQCNEAVQWTIFINRRPISGRVLNALRTLQDSDGNYLTENFRPRQSLNGREVFIQITNYDYKSESEFEQVRQNACSNKTPVSIYVLCCYLFLSSIYNN